MDVPPKVKCFAWRLSLNILPTGVNLKKKMQGFNSSCPWCGEPQEHDRYVFFDCKFARQFWDLTDLSIDFQKIKASCMKELMGIIFESGDKIEIQSFVMTLWMIWHARNKLVFEGICMKTEVIVDWVRAYLWELIKGIET